jgi:hypothetical protein
MQMCFISYGYFKRVHKFAKIDIRLYYVFVSVCPFVRMEYPGHNGQIYFKFYTSSFSKNLLRKFNFN